MQCEIVELYRFLEEPYVNEFIGNGKIRIYSFKSFAKRTDLIRKDAQEGCLSTIVKGQTVQMPPFKIETHSSPRSYALSFALSPYSYRERPKDCCIRVFRALDLAQEITEQIKTKYGDAKCLHGPCVYSGRAEVIDTMKCRPEKTLRRLFVGGDFYKDVNKLDEHEYRFVWCVPNCDQDYIDVVIREVSRYAEKFETSRSDGLLRRVKGFVKRVLKG